MTNLASQIEEGQFYQAIGAATALSLLGFIAMLAFMNPSHRQSFFGRLSMRKYIDELWDERTYAPLGQGIDASRAHILKFSKYGTQPRRRLSGPNPHLPLTPTLG